MKRYQRIGLIVAALLVLLGGIAGPYIKEFAMVGIAYKAKILCSSVFVSGRNAEAVENIDLAADDLSVLQYVDADVDYSAKTVTTTLFNLLSQTAVFRPGLGCTLVFPEYPAHVVSVSESDHAECIAHKRDALPLQQTSNPDLEAVLDWAFEETDVARLKRTRAVVVVANGRIAAERYAEGFDENTPLIAWSVAKSVMNALVGVLVQQEKLALDDAIRLPGREDERITINHLLQMTSGIGFNEDYKDPFEDVIFMLLRTADMAAYAAAKKTSVSPGTQWSYSSGTSNILSYVLRQRLGDEAYVDFPRTAFFSRIDMNDSFIELDASGTFVGSSYLYASARDLAKFGQLYLQDGVWERERILPEGWVAYSTQVVPQSPAKDFGAHFWLALPDSYSAGGYADRLPEDAFHAIGHEGQFVTIIPSRDVVIVRMGLTRLPSIWQQDALIFKVLAALGN